MLPIWSCELRKSPLSFGIDNGELRNLAGRFERASRPLTRSDWTNNGSRELANDRMGMCGNNAAHSFVCG